MTCSAADDRELQRARRQVFLALLVAVGLTVHMLENLLPSPLPWLRPGLANIAAVVALYLFGAGAAWSVNLARVGLGALLLGRLFGPGFWLSLGGCLVATALMVLLQRRCGGWLGPIGVSVAGAAGHACGQLLAARLLVLQHAAVWQLLPPFLLFSIGAGVLSGWLAAVVLEEIARHPLFRADREREMEP